ncbi:calcium-binding EGF domain-containing protein [Ditylenchus destructor]|uniref:Calcium-binding EGF domain-containing protein n=1 Tax=Ditylenchus destructor TaxID=166010 RepID=A0AAD4QYS6_9BILA|nr:calcium-binding EGF domain-containing protein [Ditylenchus destructor]
MTRFADIDECKLSEQATDESSKKCTKEHETCVNKPGSFVCECEKDYIREDYKDDGPCIFDPDKCYEGCKDGCTGEGPKACKSCQDGYIMDENEGCKDIDECKISSEATDESSKKCTKEHEVCVNTPGSFNCECDKGYVREEGNDDSLCVPEVKADDQSGKGTKEESEILMSGTVDGKSETEGGAMPISEAILGTANILTEKDQKEESENVVSDSDDGRSETTETEGGALPINEAILSMGDSSHKDNKDEL